MLIALILTQFIGFRVPSVLAMSRVTSGLNARFFSGLLSTLSSRSLVFSCAAAGDFYAFAIMVGLVQGGTQALSRSLFATDGAENKEQRVLRFFQHRARK